MKNRTKVADGIQDAKPLFSLSISEFKSLHQQLIAEALQRLQPAPASSGFPSSLDEFVDDYTARCILSANPQKPIGRPLFNKLRKEGKIHTYGASQGRTCFSRKELNALLTANKKS